MSDPTQVNIAAWVDKASGDPVAHLERQATEIILNAIGTAPHLKNKIFLKGGILMGLAYDSPRQTADIDFTATLIADSAVAAEMREALDAAFPRVAAQIGYPDLVCRVQSIEQRPREANFADAMFPALKFRIAYARRESRQYAHLVRGQCSDVVSVDFSFNEPVSNIQVLKLGGEGAVIHAYSLVDLIAEKYRAFLQQGVRNRARRQDVFDIALLLNAFQLAPDERQTVLSSLIEKCRSRAVEPNVDSISDPDLIKRARAEWDLLALEIGPLPSFEGCFAPVEAFYRSLPWKDHSTVHGE